MLIHILVIRDEDVEATIAILRWASFLHHSDARRTRGRNPRPSHSYGAEGWLTSSVPTHKLCADPKRTQRETTRAAAISASICSNTTKFITN